MPKEIVTLSFGSYASYVSAHYWNLQDESAGYSGGEGWSDYAASVDHNVLFMQQENRNGAMTYRPRAVLFDLAGSGGGVSFSPDGAAVLPVASASDGATASAPTWRGRCEVHRSEPVPRSAFVEQLEEEAEQEWEDVGEEEAARQQAALEAAALQLEGTGVRYWTDYCKAVFHPRSICCLPGLWSGVHEHSLAAGWGAAADLMGGGFGGLGGAGRSDVLEGISERVRFLGEACDSLAGFQVFVDDHTGFGALAAAALAEVVEDYAGRPLVLFSLRPPEQEAAAGSPSTTRATARARDILTEGMAVARMSELASLYVPLAAPADRRALPYLSYSPGLPFHSSAILAAAIDTALLPTRLTGVRSPLGAPLGATDLHSLVRLLRPATLRSDGCAGFAALHLALPCPALVADTRQLQEQQDERVPHPRPAAAASASHGSGAAGSAGAASASCQLVLRETASLTPGISGRDDPADAGVSHAESYCIRGGRTDSGPASTAAALQALDALLLQHPHRRCVRHRCTAPLPLAVPLPYPDIFSRSVSVYGNVDAGRPARPVGQGVRCTPVMTRLHATAEFEGWLKGLHSRWAKEAAGAAGRGVLDTWDVGQSDAAEIQNQLQGLAASYADDGDDM
ncbi:Protein misato 1 [Tetrabaena socialis]|uniref:Protein misato 1 n=1 Tax=Tetrabaena socialis TaxID=47790 RepID=A0A2J8A868_9CHLO|nr:Protein misato 1 [Tetrabaena socialis]|eukprot:PNH08711.1 Protein misato 1 [Tetrabaena socialis]